jgi:hypothetical protein
MVDGVNQQPGFFQRIGNFFGAGDPNAGGPTDPFANLSRAQRTMLGFDALRDAAAALEGRDTNFFAESLGGFESARDRERLRTQGMLQNLANIEQQIAISQFTGIPVSPAVLQMRDMIAQQLAPSMPAPVSGEAVIPAAGVAPSPAPSAAVPAVRPTTSGAVMDATGAVVGDIGEEPISPTAQAAMAGAPTPVAPSAPPAAPSDDIQAQIEAEQQRQLELLAAINEQGRGAQALGIPANTAALEAELRIVQGNIDRLRSEAGAGEVAAKAAETARLESEDAARQSGYYVNLIESVIQDPKLEGIVGRIEGRVDPQGAFGAALFDEGEMNIIGKLEQLGGAAFLEAFESLKGGGQITEIEGQKATAAITRLGQRAVSPENYRAALEELRQVYANAQARARGQELPFPEINVEGAAPQNGLTPEQQALVDRYSQ